VAAPLSIGCVLSFSKSGGHGEPPLQGDHLLRSYQFCIEQPDARQRLDEFLASRFGSLSRMRIANLIQAGACVVNGAAGRAGYRIEAGDAVEVSFDEGAPTSMFREHIPLDVAHEDEHLIVVVKPAGMLVHPTMSVKSGTLANALAYYLNRSRNGSEIEEIEDRGSRIETSEASSPDMIDPQSSILNPRSVLRPGLVHRLDRATSGLIVVAKTPRALTTLSRHFRKRLVEKRYLALVHGNVDRESGSINAPIGRDPDQLPHWRVMEDGRPAETRYKVLERLDRATLLELEPVTGRTNQLRIHCAHVGHPIVGDEMHSNFGLRISDCGLGAEIPATRESAIANPQSAIRLCLHAWKLAFHHPANGDWISLSSPLPGDIAEIIQRYRSGK
jgi:23S rRNA pseudouridine1911/1915/1917 synthase